MRWPIRWPARTKRAKSLKINPEEDQVRIPPSPQLVSQTFRRKPVDRVLTGFLLDESV